MLVSVVIFHYVSNKHNLQIVDEFVALYNNDSSAICIWISVEIAKV